LRITLLALALLVAGCRPANIYEARIPTDPQRMEEANAVIDRLPIAEQLDVHLYLTSVMHDAAAKVPDLPETVTIGHAINEGRRLRGSR
jgi:hypothetical protein